MGHTSWGVVVRDFGAGSPRLPVGAGMERGSRGFSSTPPGAVGSPGFTDLLIVERCKFVSLYVTDSGLLAENEISINWLYCTFIIRKAK